MKTITILGSTGSIGRQTADVVKKTGLYRVIGLAAGRNVSEAAQQVRELCPERVCMATEEAAKEMKALTGGQGPEILFGGDGLKELIRAEKADIYSVSIGGMAALKPTLWAIETGARIALSNKEAIVTAGHLMTDAVKRFGAELIPVDSEHSAVFQCLEGEDRRRAVPFAGRQFRR